MKKYKGEILGILVVVALILLDAYACPLLTLTGLPCPCCGMTRAWLMLLKGEVAEAFALHPLFILPLAALVGIIISIIRGKRPKRRTMDTIHIATGVLFFVVYIVRFITETNV